VIYKIALLNEDFDGGWVLTSKCHNEDVVCVRDVAGLALLPTKLSIRSEIVMQKAERSEPKAARPRVSMKNYKLKDDLRFTSGKRPKYKRHVITYTYQPGSGYI
jgi:hypothetical protein